MERYSKKEAIKALRKFKSDNPEDTSEWGCLCSNSERKKLFRYIDKYNAEKRYR